MPCAVDTVQSCTRDRAVVGRGRLPDLPETGIARKAVPPMLSLRQIAIPRKLCFRLASAVLPLLYNVEVAGNYSKPVWV